jgi:hypothetical protein
VAQNLMQMKKGKSNSTHLIQDVHLVLFLSQKIQFIAQMQVIQGRVLQLNLVK